MDQIGDLTLFSTVARSGSLAAAAGQLNMSPSGVSRRLKRFEDRLGVRLFNRTTRSLNMTEAGVSLLERSGDILAAIEEAENAASLLNSDPHGTIRVAASDAFALDVAVPFLKTFRRKYPNLRVMLLQGDGPIDILGSGIDLAIRFEMPTATSFIVRRLAADPWVICASPEYLSKSGSIASPQDLRDHPCLLIHANARTTGRWQFCRADGETYELDIEGSVFGIGLVVREAALAGLGVARLAHFLVREYLEDGALVQVLAEHMPQDDRSIYAVYPDRQFLPTKVRVFLDELSEYLKLTIGHQAKTG
ncbi:MAG: LysR family transcriptional regulator [Pseudomonadota bacterium]